jgi:hypothetical protein
VFQGDRGAVKGGPRRGSAGFSRMPGGCLEAGACDFLHDRVNTRQETTWLLPVGAIKGVKLRCTCAWPGAM